MWTKRWQDFLQRRIARRKRGVENPDEKEEDVNNAEIVEVRRRE